MDTSEALNFINEIKSYPVFINDSEIDKLAKFVKSLDFKVRAYKFYLKKFFKAEVIFQDMPEDYKPGEGEFSIELIVGEKV